MPGLSMTIDTSSLKIFAGKLEKFGAQGKIVANNIAKKTSLFALREIKTGTPARTGFTRASWQVTEIPEGYEVGSNSKIAVFLEEGTKPHKIFPKNKKALAWGSARALADNAGVSLSPKSFSRAGGAIREGVMRTYGNLAQVVARYVNHPGTKAQRIVAGLLPGILAFMDQTAKAEVAELEGYL